MNNSYEYDIVINVSGVRKDENLIDDIMFQCL